MKARDIMTGSLITCSPDTSVSQVAKLMRDGNTGDVLVTDGGKIKGIITDRDIAVRAAAMDKDLREEPVRNYMSSHVMTGSPDWDLDKVAKTMGKHQIRRLPIVDNGWLVGIVSLGDVALRHDHKPRIAQSLKAISEPTPMHYVKEGGSRLLPLLVMGLAVAAVAFTMSPRGETIRKRVRESGIPDTVRDRVRDARLADRVRESHIADRIRDARIPENIRDRLDDPRFRKMVRERLKKYEFTDSVRDVIGRGRERISRYM